MWDLPGPGIKPVSPALAGGFLTTAPPGKSQTGKLISKSKNLSYLTPHGNQIVDKGKIFIEKLQLTIASGMREVKYCHFTTCTELMDLSGEYEVFLKLLGERLKRNFFNRLTRLATL